MTLYRLLLQLLPARIRDKHGEAMEQLFHRQLEEASHRGRLSWLGAYCGGMLDLAQRSVYERIRPLSNRTGIPAMGSFAHDLRFALRSLRRAPRFTVLIVLALGLGIGVNTALYSVIHGVVLRPLPFPDEERVVHLAWNRAGDPVGSVPAYKYEFWAERMSTLQAVTTWRAGTLRLGPEEEAESVGALRVPHTFLEVLGFEPALGRGLVAGDDAPDGPAVALLGHSLWQTRFGGDPGVLGRTVTVSGAPHTVVGVLPADFAFPHAPDHDRLLVPLRLQPDPTDEAENWRLLARLSPGATIEQAEAELARVSELFRSEHPELTNATDRGMMISSFEELYVGGTTTTLWVLMGATVLVLLTACANAAALLLARGTRRRAEFAIRSALGAGRRRLVQQLLVESLVLSGLGCLAGLAVAHFGVEALLGLYPGRLPRTEWIGLNPTVLTYTALVATATGISFGLAAAVPSLRSAASDALREGGRGSTAHGRLRRIVLAAESALSVVLLVGAGLLISTLAELNGVAPGFDADGLVVATLPEPAGGWETGGGIRAVERTAIERLETLPGIVSVATASSYPLQRGMNIPVGIEGRPEDYEGAVEWRAVSGDYLEALDTPLIRGRSLRPTDGEDGPHVALVNRAFAERYFPDRNPVGQRIEIGRYRDRYVHPSFDVGGVEIVGVIDDVREISLKEEARRTVIVPAAQAGPMGGYTPLLLIRTESGVPFGTLRSELAAMAGGPPPDLRTMSQVVSSSLARERFNAILMTVFALVALALTGFGIYAVVSYGVRQRTREIGIRMALGAPRRSVVGQVTRTGLLPVVVGLGAGVALSLGLSGFLESLLWGVEPTDPLTIAAVAGVLALIALGACYVPARYATRIDPQRTLRTE